VNQSGEVLPQKVRLRFAKRGRLKFISHHDMMRLFERALRRAGLPIRSGQGFNPRPKISFALALALGVEAAEEAVDIQLARWVPVRDVQRRVAEQLPTDIPVMSAELVPTKSVAQVQRVEYEVDISGWPPPDATQIETLLARDSIPVERVKSGKTKTVEVRPFIEDVRLQSNLLTLFVKVSNQGTVRPDEVLALLGMKTHRNDKPLRITRTRVHLAKELRKKFLGVELE